MAKLKVEELRKTLIERLKPPDEASEEEQNAYVKIVEDINDTITSEEGNWKEKYLENDKNWRKKYLERFSGKVDSEEENANTSYDEKEKPKNFEDLFEVK